MSFTYSDVLAQLEDARRKLPRFSVNFIDERGYQTFIRNMPETLRSYENICLTGYFSEASAQELIRYKKGLRAKIRILSPELNLSRRRGQQNLNALRKMQDIGVEIKVHLRLHCRIFIAYTLDPVRGFIGHVILGSFDYNDEGINLTKRNAGIKTMNPDLLKSAVEYFEEIWEEPRDTKSLDEMYPE